ncbi:FAD-dependent oxidoreductase [Saccharopolyspora sp. K220]|uniref:FAD-binding oxidoreductase n=1 Tax=Saccharopolyspora soli TaxID=2926618 RepID=UPI001F56EA92|nr:FAD-dependent oxidoreductase [Saccharopolyspora soli]MCI2421252.1 FAD-dependent oxidoreductase [Saccharopolyspora soli]
MTGTVDGLRMTGSVLRPDDAGYEQARGLFNGAIRARPRMIAQCVDAADVAAALTFVQQNSVEVAVRSGGHSVSGASTVDGGLVIDMRAMNSVSVEPGARTATVGGGALWRDVDRATQTHGLATTGGRVSTTGVAGFTLGGGSGWLERKFGLACDNLLAVELVTADGRRVVASDVVNPELFWGLHGGGGNFGIATSFTFRLHELPVFSAALMFWPAEDGPPVVRAYRDVMTDAPGDFGGGALFVTAPPEDFVPESLVGSLSCAILVTCTGPETELRGFIEPLLALRPAGSLIAELPYAELQCMLDDPPGYRNYWSAEYLRELPDPAVDLFCDRAADMPVPSPSQHVLFPWGGAVARSDGRWPMANRSTPWVVHPFGLWDDPADDVRARDWAHALRDDLRPYTTGAVYLNFIGDEGQSRVVAGFGEQNYRRLARLKAEYDPRNVFHRWHNVLPAED